jgi:hypothetical protein
MPRKLKTKLRENEFYCVSCRARKNSDSGSICVKVYNNSRSGPTPTLKGQCSVCGTNLTKFIKRDSTERMVRKYGEC